LLCEQKEENRAVWQGKQYTTDNKVWLISKPAVPIPEKLELLGLPNEHVVKMFLDEYPERCGEFMSYSDVCKFLNLPIPENIEFIWDEEQKLFIWKE